MTRVYAAMRSGLLAVEAEEGRIAAETLDGRALECVAVPSEAPERVYVGTFESGLWRSVDGAESFERVGERTLPDAITSLAVDPHDGSLWLGTEPSEVFHSTDDGETWTEKEGLTDLPSASGWSFPPRPHTHHVRWIEPDPTDPGTLYVGIEAGALVRTEDGGETWRDRPEGSRLDNHQLACHPDAPGTIWTAAGDGYAESGDGGDTWAYPQDGLDHRYCWSVAVDSEDPECVLVSSASGARSAHTPPGESYVYRKVGGGAWTRLDERGLPMGEGVLRAVLAAAEPGAFYALNDRGLFYSTDRGSSWSTVLDEWPRRFRGETARGIAVP